ncbi:DUF1289 domain-containing protein [Alteromonadaceae bacterium M269]|nr:DUF1289 domain-containing protein [Alteromonadaceae bacterium M269]
MKQLEFFEIPSPCIGVCQSGPKGFCVGCFRSRDERLYWNKLEPEAKRIIIKASAARKRRAMRKGDSTQKADEQNQQQWDF